jgi:hypothetical protein
MGGGMGSSVAGTGEVVGVDLANYSTIRNIVNEHVVALGKKGMPGLPTQNRPRILIF